MTEAPETSETPSGHLRWVKRPQHRGCDLVLQQQFYRTTYEGIIVTQSTIWRDVPVVAEE